MSGKNMIKVFGLMAVLACVGVSGCGKEKQSLNYQLASAQNVASGTVAENEKFTLDYDSEKGVVSVQRKSTGMRWGTIPASYQGENEEVLSAIRIEVIHNTTKTVDFDHSYTASVATRHFSDEKKENGLTICYYFDAYQVMVPVSYILQEDFLEIVIETGQIQEGDTYRLLNISVAPYLCSVQNEKEQSYLFVPTANGGLMYTDVRPDGARNFSEEVYGADASREIWENPIEADPVKMPVFGVKNGQEAMFGIVDCGAETTVLHADAGDANTGYSKVYATMYVRGYDVYASERDSDSTTTVRNAEDMVKSDFTIRYYPLTDCEADYNGMAHIYKAYLADKGLQKTTADSTYALTVLGGVKTKSLMFGVPYKSVKKLTDMSEAMEIIEDVSKESDSYPTVQMVGYGESGIDVGKIAGNFSFGKVSGSKKQYRELEALSEQKGFLLSMDFDVVRFNESGAGVNTWMDTAKSASLYKTKRYYNSIALGDYDKESAYYYLVSRDRQEQIMERLTEVADKYGISGISLSTLGRLAYSDYGDESTYIKSNTEKSIQAYLRQIAGQGRKVVTDDANIYAAIHSDAILNITLEPAELYCIDEYIPFYQMVLKGSKPLYSEALNLTGDYSENVLRALESGTGFGYTVIGNYDTSYATTVHDNLYHSLYEDVKEQMITDITAYRDYYEAIQGAEIQEHQILESGVTKTVFVNGVTAYVNHTDGVKETEAGMLEAMSFMYRKGE